MFGIVCWERKDIPTSKQLTAQVLYHDDNILERTIPSIQYLAQNITFLSHHDTINFISFPLPPYDPTSPLLNFTTRLHHALRANTPSSAALTFHLVPSTKHSKHPTHTPHPSHPNQSTPDQPIHNVHPPTSILPRRRILLHHAPTLRPTPQTHRDLASRHTLHRLKLHRQLHRRRPRLTYPGARTPRHWRHQPRILRFANKEGARSERWSVERECTESAHGGYTPESWED